MLSLLVSLLILPLANAELSAVTLGEVISEGKRLRTDYRGVVMITEDDLARESGRTIGEVLREAAGVDYISGTGGNSNLLIRGSSGSQVLVIIDGVKANDPSASNRYFDWSRIDVAQVERIEVLKGPQAVSYGSDAIGGVVVIRTKRGQSGFQASVEGGSEAFLRSRVSYALNLNPEHALKFYTLGKGVFAGKSSAVGVEGDHSREASVGVELDSQFSESFRTKLQADVRAAQEDIDQGAYDDDPNDVARNREIRGALHLEGRQWKGLLSHLDFRRAYSDYPDAAHTYSSDLVYHGKNSRAEFQVHSGLPGGAPATEWVMGTEFTRESLGIDSLLTPASLKKNHSETAAVFAESSLPLDSNGVFSLDFGSRFSHFTTFGNQWSGKTGGTVKVNENFAVDLGISTGFKAPSLYSLYDSTYGNEQLRPEESVQSEIGGTYTPVRSTKLELRGFLSRVRNRFGYAPSPSFRSLNIADAEVDGLEGGVEHRFTTQFRIASSVTYLSSLDRKTGEPLTDISKWKESLKFVYSPAAPTSITLSFLMKSAKGASTGAGRVPGFGRLDLSATQELTQNFSMNARIENLLDHDYEEVRGYRTPGFSAYAGAEYRGF